jgi:hypothetical protein
MSSASRLGQWVHYTLGEDDARRADQLVPRLDSTGSVNRNQPRAGETYPALILRDHGGSANLKVFLDGGHGAELWVTSRAEGEGEGKWTQAR